MCTPNSPRSGDGRSAVAQVAAGLLLATAFTVLWAVFKPRIDAPLSTDIVFVDRDSAVPLAVPEDLPSAGRAGGPVVRIGFVGDIMQHLAQATDDFAASYARVAPLIEGFDLAVGNLEFPVDPSRPVGPPFGSVRFNGAPSHLDALADAGFDVLSTANNHAFDQGLDGALATVESLRARGLVAVGTGETDAPNLPVVVEAGGLTVAFAAYTMRPNGYDSADGEIEWWSPDWPINELNFFDWTAEYRREGVALFDAHAAQVRDVDLRVALVHWGDEWHFQPSEDQRLAAHDMIDAGFDLVIGGHSHVLNGPELYRGGLIAYSLGNFISDFVATETRTGAVLEVAVAPGPSGGAEIVDFGFYAVLTERDGHVVTPLALERTGERRDAWSLAERIVGPSLTAYEGPRRRDGVRQPVESAATTPQRPRRSSQGGGAVGASPHRPATGAGVEENHTRRSTVPEP